MRQLLISALGSCPDHMRPQRLAQERRLSITSSARQIQNPEAVGAKSGWVDGRRDVQAARRRRRAASGSWLDSSGIFSPLARGRSTAPQQGSPSTSPPMRSTSHLTDRQPAGPAPATYAPRPLSPGKAEHSVPAWNSTSDDRLITGPFRDGSPVPAAWQFGSHCLPHCQQGIRPVPAWEQEHLRLLFMPFECVGTDLMTWRLN